MWVLGFCSILILCAAAVTLRATRRHQAALRLMRLSAHELRSIGIGLHGQAGARQDSMLALTAAQVSAVADTLHGAGAARPPALRDERIALDAAIAAAVTQTSAAILPGTRLWRLPCGPVPELWADARALRHILGHVLADCVRATREGDWIEIDVQHRRDALAIVVTDEGAGLVVTPAGPAVPRDSRGIGLRLALARQLLHALGGHMEIESRLGVGTRVSIVLPASRIRTPLTLAQAAE